jgi:hypothetical protein
MDPMFDLAGPLLRKLYPDWVSIATIERAPASLPARRLRIALKQGIVASDPVPPPPQPDDETRCRVAIADAVPPREWESLRLRREHVTAALYRDTSIAVAAARIVGRYPSYIAEVAREVVGAPMSERPALERARVRHDRRTAAGLVAFPATAKPFTELPVEEVADRLVADPSLVTEVADALSLPRPFSYVLQEELSEIAASRRVRLESEEHAGTGSGETRAFTYPPRTAHNMQLSGLALSGGGIRSATFSLGVLHALSELDLLRRIDYLSTVSGGGYIGSWLVAWIKRLDGGVREVQQRLSPRRAAHPSSVDQRPIRMLRDYSNYLTPQTGFLSGDTWTMVAVWVRNTLLNQLVVVSFLMTFLVLPRWIGPLAHSWNGIGLAALVLAAFSISVIAIAVNLRAFEDEASARHDEEAHRESEGGLRALGQADGGVIVTVLAPMTLACVGCAVWFWRIVEEGRGVPGQLIDLDVFRVMFTAFWVGQVVIQLFGRYARCALPESRWGQPGWMFVAHLWMAALGAVAAATGALLIAFVPELLRRVPHAALFWSTITFVPPLLLALVTFTVVLHIGLMGRQFPDERREWWSRLAAHQLRLGTIWLALFALTVFAPSIVKAGPVVLGALAIGWGAITWAGVLAGKAAAAGVGTPASSKKRGHYIALVAPYVFIAGLLVVVSVIVHGVLVRIECPANACAPGATLDQWLGWESLVPDDVVLPGVLLVVVGAVSFALSLRVDVNEFSMHHFYKNRLVRCYLGASRDQWSRRPNRFTGFDPRDDVKLKDLQRKNAASGLPYEGPYPIINAALNLTKGKELAWQERKAEPFVFTPHYTGYEIEDYVLRRQAVRRAGYRPTAEFAYPGSGGIGLGTAAAISGAAANPNMGFHSAPATAFLLTLFNARLGWWVGNPRYSGTWRNPSPALGLAYLTKEMFGSTDNRTRYVNLSDGGHFENLGLYELVRRRCRYIIAVDAEQDKQLAFNGLAGAIRKCRSDFGVIIDVDTDAIGKSDVDGGTHCAVGRIHYPEPGHCTGWLLYLKASMTGDEPPDVTEYSKRQSEFPHQSTGDQWFDESQFESYRALGYHIVRQSFDVPRGATALANVSLETLFESLYSRWHTTPSKVELALGGLEQT